MYNNGISIAVIGGGIGGLTAALCLHKIGIDVHVYEQARILREVGAGINVTPNATPVIHALGLGEALAKLGVMPTGVHQRRWDDGRTLLRTPLDTGHDHEDAGAEKQRVSPAGSNRSQRKQNRLWTLPDANFGY
jgi:2-polyprenyl-6-methoxyphenol hydroxylase-like FAD-dependent oxidoreductase